MLSQTLKAEQSDRLVKDATFPALEIDNTNRFVGQMAACGMVWKVGPEPPTTVRLTPEGMVHVS